jgi:hypothetical protein
LKVSPSELHRAADKIEGHAADFADTHQTAQWRAGQAVLGSGLAGAALPEMLGAWDTDGSHFGQRFTTHAGGHRTAADAYQQADGRSADWIGDASSAL